MVTEIPVPMSYIINRGMLRETTQTRTFEMYRLIYSCAYCRNLIHCNKANLFIRYVTILSPERN